MNLNNLANAVHATDMILIADCVHQFEMVSKSETDFFNGPVTSESCSQSCEDVPGGPTSESCSQSCDGPTSESCSQSCAEIAMSPMTFICDSPATASCSESCRFDVKFDEASSATCSETCETPVTSECSETCRIDGVSQIRNFSAPPQYQRTSQSYQVAPTFLC